MSNYIRRLPYATKCYTCSHWKRDSDGFNCCVISKGLDCYHNNNEPWKWWKPKNINIEFISAEEMML